MSAAGRVVVVALGDTAADVARRLAAGGATVVLVGPVGGDPEAGRLAAEMEAAGSGRPAVFVGDDLDALAEFVSEVFRGGSGTPSA